MVHRFADEGDQLLLIIQPPTSAKKYLHRRIKYLHWRTRTNDGVILLSKTHKEVKSIFGLDLVLRPKIFKKKNNSL